MQRLKSLRPTVKEQMLFQENTVFDIEHKVKVTQDVAQYHLHYVTYKKAKFVVAASNGLDTFIRQFSIDL